MLNYDALDTNCNLCCHFLQFAFLVPLVSGRVILFQLQGYYADATDLGIKDQWVIAFSFITNSCEEI